MVLIVGLGNPGPKYKFTRHNVGFRVVDELHSSSPSLLLRKNSVIDKFVPLTLKGVVLAKPKNFMNLSGQAVRNLLKNHNLKPDNLIVVHDDIDIPLGEIRIVKNRGAGGHKGVQSIVNELKSKNFIRFRIGIQPKFGKPRSPKRFVLQKFNKEEEKIIKEMINKTVKAIEMTLKEGIEKAMSKFNK